MKSRFLTPVLIVILLAILVYVFLLPKTASNPLKSPLGSILQNNSATPQPAASNYAPPKEVKLDASSDLGIEIDKVNPQVLNADFEIFNSL